MSGGPFVSGPFVSAAWRVIVLGLAVVAWPLIWAPAWVAVWAAPAGTAAACVFGFGFGLGSGTAGAVGAVGPAGLGGAVGRRRRAATVVVAVAVVACGLSRAGDLVLAAEGLLILGYLLAADTLLARLGPAGRVRWWRRELPSLVAGVVASGVVLGALAIRLPVSAWLTISGLVALVIAYRIAVPATRRRW